MKDPLPRLLTMLVKRAERRLKGQVALGFAVGSLTDRRRLCADAVAIALKLPDLDERDLVTLFLRGRVPKISLKGRARAAAHQKGLTVWHVSLSHESGKLIVLMVGSKRSAGLRGCGVDCSKISRFKNFTQNIAKLQSFADKVLSESEKRKLSKSRRKSALLAHLWALKEACYKALPDPKPPFLSVAKDLHLSPSFTVFGRRAGFFIALALRL